MDGIEDAAVKEKVEDILNGFPGELIDTYVSINASMQGMTKQEQYILKAAMGIEAFRHSRVGELLFWGSFAKKYKLFGKSR